MQTGVHAIRTTGEPAPSPTRQLKAWSRDDRGATTLPELLTVSVTSIIVLGAILIALVTMDTVSARTGARSDALRSLNLTLRTITQDVRGAFAVAPLDPAHPEAAGDGIALLVQQGTTGAARDPRVWVVYSCPTTAGKRSCSRSVYAAEANSTQGCTAYEGAECADRTLPEMIVADGRFARGALISRGPMITDLATGVGAAKVFALGWPSDSGSGTCSEAECITWGFPVSYGDARLDPRGFYRRASGDSRPPVVRVTLQSQPHEAPVPVAVTTSLSPRGCVDPSAPAITGNQFEC